MSGAQLVEKTRSLVLDTIKKNIEAKLSEVRTDRADAQVTTEPPKSYFIYEATKTLRCPAVFCLVDSLELPEAETGANHVNGIVRMFVSVVIEDREADKLTIKSERYQTALFEILHWATLQDVAKNVKLWVRVVRCEFSPLYTKKRGEDLAEFRKEVSLELEVKHFES